MWSIGNAPDPSTDGILTAEEVTSLDLNGTNLVTLSACESGVGEAKSGEGVFGLRRSFMMAGAQNLLMTLWPVDDITTADLMVDFYSQLFIDGKVRQSLASTQREWLLKLRQTNGILDSIRKAGPFVLATTGNTHLN
jgi:CHAT domain-containing protein